jgi:VWFA-related protein
LAVAFALASVVTATRGAPQAPPTFPARVELVRLDVVVVDGDGQPVTGLTASDFEVEENGRPRAIESFESIVVKSPPAAPEAPRPPRVSVPRVFAPQESRCLLIFFDDVHVTTAAAEWVRQNLASFLERQVKDGDWVMIATPETGLMWMARTPWEHRQLPAAVQHLQGQLVRDPFQDHVSDWQAMRAVEFDARTLGEGFPSPNNGFRAEETYAVAQRRIRRTLDGLGQALDSLSGFRGRKSLLLFSEGFIRAPAVPLYERVIELARRANATVEWIDPRGLESGRPNAEVRELPKAQESQALVRDRELAGARFIALSTGGREFFTNDPTAALMRVLEESSAYYLLGYPPVEGGKGERKVKVHVRREGLEVHARSRYFVGPPQAKAAPVPPQVKALRAVADATDVPLRVSTALGETGTGGAVATKTTVQIDPVAGVSRERRLSLLIEARRLEGGEPVHDGADVALPATSEPSLIVRELHLRPGRWQARVVVRDEATGSLGSVLHSFEVTASGGHLPEE